MGVVEQLRPGGQQRLDVRPLYVGAGPAEPVEKRLIYGPDRSVVGERDEPARGLVEKSVHGGLATCCALTFENAIGRFFGDRYAPFPNHVSQSLVMRKFICQYWGVQR